MAYNTVGGSTSAAGNIVAFNHDLGIAKWEDGVENYIANNSIHNNDNVGLRINVNTLVTDNNVYDNGVNRIEVPVDTLSIVNQHWGPQGRTDTYFVHYTCITCELEIPSHTTLTLEPGARIRMDYNRTIKVAGTLNVLGTNERPVTLTGPRDSIWAGDWNGITFAPGSTGQIQYADISFAKTGITNQGQVTVRDLSLIHI